MTVRDAKAVLEARGLSKSYGLVPVLHDLSFTLERGRHLLLLGPSGSGKSTLINMVTGLQTPNAGEVVIAGEAMTSLGAGARDDLRKRRIGIIFQTLRLVSAVSIRANLRLAQTLAGQTVDNAATDALLETLAIAHRADARPRQLSQGEAQRAAIARALITKPDLLVADEPTSALDDANAEKVAQLLLSTAQAQGSTLLIATHDRRLTALIPNCFMLEAPVRETCP